MRKLLIVGILLLVGLGFADTYKTIFNPFTGKLDYVTQSFDNLSFNGSIIPQTDNVFTLGNSSNRWNQVWGYVNWSFVQNAPNFRTIDNNTFDNLSVTSGNLTMNSNNITAVDCIYFISGGKICDSP